MKPLTSKTRCPSCKRTQTLEECEVGGAKDFHVFCHWCHRQFEPVAVAIQREFFEEGDGDGDRDDRTTRRVGAACR